MAQDWTKLPEPSVVEKTIAAATSRGFTSELVANKDEAAAKLAELIPAGANVLTGSSTSLKQIGFFASLEAGENGWVNMNGKIWEATDPAEQSKRRRTYTAADYFVASVNAVVESGELVAVDATGTRVSSLAFPAEKVILVVSTNKIVENLDAAFARIREYVFPLENVRAQEAYGSGSTFGKWLIMEREVVPGRVHVIFVNEALGF